MTHPELEMQSPGNPTKRGSIVLLTRLLQVAWLSILLGFAMQIIAALAARFASGEFAPIAVQIRDLTQRVTWSTLVCVGVALGNAVTRGGTVGTGAIAMFAAPLAFVAAKTVQKTVAGALSVAPPEEMGVTVFGIVAALRAVEYGTLGAVLAWLAAQPVLRFRPYATSGMVAGLTCGLAVVGTLYANASPPMPTPKAIIQSVLEILFPMGCALVLYVSSAIGKLHSAANR